MENKDGAGRGHKNFAKNAEFFEKHCRTKFSGTALPLIPRDQAAGY